MKRKTRLKLFVICLSVVSLAYIVIGIVSYFQGPKIEVDQYRIFKHNENRGYYRLEVSKGQLYSFSFEYYNDELQPEIRLFSRPFKTFGKKTAVNYLVNGLAIDFTATHDGYYYVTVLNSKGGPFHVNLKNMLDFEFNTPIKKYVNPWSFMLFLVFISLIPITLGVTIDYYRNKAKDTANERWLKNSIKCPGCGIRLKKDTEYCDKCGYTFTPPPNYKNY